MGQGYSLTTLSAGSAGIDVPELADLIYETSLGEARFMKAIRARHSDGLVVTKVVMKPYASMKFGKYVKEILRERKILAEIPNALGYHRAFETSSNGYLVRQYILSSLYERFSARPFLEDVEKRWIAFQLLCAVRDCHARGIYHGDIKSENVLLTSWNWLYLTDFSSSFKPTYLPEDNPADFSFFFDISARRTCYLAPERFLSSDEYIEGKGDVTWAMDIFSAGCVIAELFLEGPIFNLSQLFRYRSGEYNPQETVLTRIEDAEIRDMVSHMINLEPESRYSADEYLNFWRHKSFPEYFYGFLHQYMHLMTDPSSGRAAITSGRENLGESDERIDRIYYDYDKIAYFLGYSDIAAKESPLAVKNPSSLFMFPLNLDIPNKRQVVTAVPHTTMEDGTLLFLNLVLSSCRSTARSTARIRACELVLAFSARLTDEARLDRVLPFLVDLLEDEVDLVKVAAIRTIAQVLAMVSTASTANAGIFADYLFLHMRKLSSPSQDATVRTTFAACLAPLAESASRILDVIYALRAEGQSSSSRTLKSKGSLVANDDVTYDSARAQLVHIFESQSKTLLTDPDADVRRAFLGSVASLCVFFGTAKASDVLLSHLNTYLNDKDWRLKCAFFQTIVGVATYVGGTNVEQFILPLMIQSLTDPQESVLEEVLKAMASMAQLGLFQRSRTWELIDLVARFTMHPNNWIREAATSFITASTTFISSADIYCIVKPIVDPYLRRSVLSFDELSLLDALKKPLSRIVFDMAVTWAQRVDKGIFWKPFAVRIRAGRSEEQIAIPSSTELDPDILRKVPMYDEDKSWIKRLETAGMTAEDKPKLVALKEFIWRTARRREEEKDEWRDQLNRIIPLKDLGIAPETVFFDQQPATASDSNAGTLDTKSPQTIQDALLDASTTIEPSNDGRPQGQSSAEHATPPAVIPPRVPPPMISSPLASSPMGNKNPSETATDPMQIPKQQKLANDPKASPANSSFSGQSDSASGRYRPQQEKRKSSALELIQGRSAGKGAASIETFASNAMGTVDTARKPESSPARANGGDIVGEAKPQARGAHTYTGRDPAVLKLLDSLQLDGYGLDSAEFGHKVTPVERRHWSKKIYSNSEGRWRPQGILVALLGEHTAAVTKVVMSPDHSFFITGSDDGTVKVWDSARLERNVSHRSRQTYKCAAGTKVTALCFLEQRHCFVCATSDGRIEVIRVECSETASGSMKYGKMRLLRRHQLPDSSSYATWMEHHRGESSSILLLATTAAKVYSLEIQTMSVVSTMANPVHHGTPLTFCTDNKHHWLLLGTSHGVLDLWDLRFCLRVRSFAFPGASPIHSIRLHPVRGSRRRQVLVAGGTASGDVTVWDLEKLACKEVYRTQLAATYHHKHPSTTPASGRQLSTDDKQSTPQRAQTPASASAATLKPYVAWNPDATPRSQILERFSNLSTTKTASTENGGMTDGGVRALYVGTRASFAENSGSSTNTAISSGEARHGFFVAAGPDRKVRFWDMDRVDNSCVVNGLEADESQPGYGAVVAGVDCVVCEERPSNAPRQVAAGMDGIGRDGTSNKNRQYMKGDRSRGSVISLQQQTLLKSHLDLITDVAVLEYPYPMVVSTDRAGMVYVFA